jgi:hypothetical protein
MNFQLEQANSYTVEVSGWDSSNNFFVERTTLDWDEDETKRVSVRSAVREGSVVFLRLLQPFGDGTSLPVACRAVKIAARSSDGRGIVHLVQLHPRSSVEGTAHTTEAVAFKVA